MFAMLLGKKMSQQTDDNINKSVRQTSEVSSQNAQLDGDVLDFGFVLHIIVQLKISILAAFKIAAIAADLAIEFRGCELRFGLTLGATSAAAASTAAAHAPAARKSTTRRAAFDANRSAAVRTLVDDRNAQGAT